MLEVLTTAVLAVLVGGLLGFRSTSEGWLAPLRAFSVVAIAGIAILELLPEATRAGGIGVLAAAVLALVIPSAWHRMRTSRAAHSHGVASGAAPSARGRGVALELAYVSLLVHKLSDGLGLGTAFGGAHADHGHWEVAVALAAHTIPMAAVVALAFRGRGRLHAWLRVGGLAVALGLGLGLVELVERGPFVAVRPWFDAIAAGLLLHILLHDLPTPRVRTPQARLVELAAIAAGVAVTILGLHGHEGESDNTLAHGLAELALLLAPTMLAGLVIGAAVQALAGPLSLRWLEGKSDLSRAARGAITGAPLPICACNIQPVAASLEHRGAATAAVVAFLLATPGLGLDTVLVTGGFFGWPLALVRLLGALGLAIAAAWVTARLAARVATAPARDLGRLQPLARSRGLLMIPPTRAGASALRAVVRVAAPPPPPGTSPDDCGPEHAHHAPASLTGGPRERFLRALLELVEHNGPWIVIGLVAAAYAAEFVPAGALSGLPLGVDIALVSLIAVPTYVCAASATPLAAVLVLKGLSPGAALAGLLLGPATNLAMLAFMRRRVGLRATLGGLAAAVAFAAALGLAVNASGLARAGDALPDALPHAVELGALALLGALTVLSLWRSGLASWVAALHGHHDHPRRGEVSGAEGAPIDHVHDAMDHVTNLAAAEPRAAANNG